MAESNHEPILAYLREHSGRYSPAALRRQLIESGQDPEDVDRAIRIFEEERPRDPVGPLRWLVVAVNALVLAVLLWQGEQGQYWLAGPVIGLFMICCAELVIGLVLLIPWRSRRWGRDLLQGLGLSAGLALLVLGGLCVAGPH